MEWVPVRIYPLLFQNSISAINVKNYLIFLIYRGANIIMDHTGVFGPFKNPDDINKFWYQFTEKELEKDIQRAKKDLEDATNSKEDTKLYKQDVRELTDELSNLRNFADEYTRCCERYKYDKKALRQIQKDWSDYNSSLYSGWSMVQAVMLNPDLLKGEARENWRREAKAEKIKREEIEKRIRDFLQK